MVKHGHKKEKNKKSSLLYNIKTSEDKTERNLNEGTVWVKALFQERQDKGAFHQTLQNLSASDREVHLRYMITQTKIPSILQIYIGI